MHLLFPALSAVLLSAPVPAAMPPARSPAPSAAAKSRPVDPPSAQELASIMRALLIAALPSPLIENSHNWGKQKRVWNGLKVRTEGLKIETKRQRKLKNDGSWRRLKVEAINPGETLTLLVNNVRQPDKGRLTFDVIVALPVRIHFEQQIWESGVKLYGGTTKARCRPILALKCESTSRAEKNGGAIPDVIFRMRVLDAKVTYDQLKFERAGGVGGDLADPLGQALFDMIRAVRPSLEKDMLAKANRAIVKAADTKEVRLGLGRLFEGK
jgi:hypothetical protein